MSVRADHGGRTENPRSLVIEELARTLTRIVGERGVRRDEPTRTRVSMDDATMSPIIMGQTPLGRAEIVAIPSDVDQVPEIVAQAVSFQMPLTSRGRGT